jgi:hypothetical protein
MWRFFYVHIFTWLSKDMNSYHINSYVHMNSYMQNKNSLPLTDHVNCASWRFFGFYFFSVHGIKTFFSLSRGKIVWRQMVRSTHAVRKIRSIRNCMYGTYVGKQSSAQHRGRRAQKVHASVRKKIPLSSQVSYILQTYHEIWEHTWINRPFLANIWFQKGKI